MGLVVGYSYTDGREVIKHGCAFSLGAAVKGKRGRKRKVGAQCNADTRHSGQG